MMDRPTLDHVRELLNYDTETGRLSWRVDRNGIAKAGCRAGYERADGYWVVCMGGRIILLHRLAWFHFTGAWPVAMIDHIDGDHGNNAIRNLREATRSQNMMNMALPPRNTSGTKGVSFFRQTGKWEAYITVDRCRRRLGYFADLADACAARRAAEARLFGSFARGS